MDTAGRRAAKAIGMVAVILALGIGAMCLTMAPQSPPSPSSPQTSPSPTASAAPSATSGSTQPPSPTRSQAELTIEAFAGEHGLTMGDYPTSLINLLIRNPETEDFVLQYPLEYGKEHEVDLSEYRGSGDQDGLAEMPLFLQWDKRWGYLQYGADVVGLTGCGPVSLAMVGFYLTGDDKFSPDKMVAYALENDYCVKGNGSAWTLISQGAVDLGLDVTEIPLNRERILANLEAGNPIICVVGPGDFTLGGHFMVLSGCEDGRIKIHDPNSRINSAKLWDYDRLASQIEALWVVRYDG